MHQRERKKGNIGIPCKTAIMRKSWLYTVVLAFLLLAASCNSADKNVGKIASDYCDCLRKLDKSMSSETKKIISKASNSADPARSIQYDVMALDEEKQLQIGKEMVGVGDMEDENSEIGRCIKRIEKKYDNAYTMNEEKFLKKLIKELETDPGCGLTASLLKLGLKMQDKPGFE